MKQEHPNEKNQRFSEKKEPYTPPKARRVPVKMEERVMGCNFGTIRACGVTE